MGEEASNAFKAERIETDTHSVACDGGGGALGHPKVFLEMGGDTEIQCPYCSRLFVLKKSS